MNFATLTDKHKLKKLKELTFSGASKNNWKVNVDIIHASKRKYTSNNREYIEFYIMDDTAIMKAIYNPNDSERLESTFYSFQPGRSFTLGIGDVRFRYDAREKKDPISVMVNGKEFDFSNMELYLHKESFCEPDNKNIDPDSYALALSKNSVEWNKILYSNCPVTEDKSLYTPISRISTMRLGKALNIKARVLDVSEKEGISEKGFKWHKKTFKIGDSSDHCIDLSIFLRPDNTFSHIQKGDVVIANDVITKGYRGNHQLDFKPSSMFEVVQDPEITEDVPEDNEDKSWTDLSQANAAQLYNSFKQIDSLILNGDPLDTFKIEGILNEPSLRDKIPFYPACTVKDCLKGVTGFSDGYECKTHGPIDDCTFRYKLSFSVEDKQDTVVYTNCFDRLAEEMLKISAKEVIESEQFATDEDKSQEIADRFKLAKEKEDGLPRLYLFTMKVSRYESRDGENKYNFQTLAMENIDPSENQPGKRKAGSRYVPYRGESVLKKQKTEHAPVNMASAY